MHIAEHETDGVIQFVGNAGHEAAERCHFLGEHQLLLRLTQLLVSGGELGIGPPEFADRTTYQNETDKTPLVIAA